MEWITTLTFGDVLVIVLGIIIGWRMGTIGKRIRQRWITHAAEAQRLDDEVKRKRLDRVMQAGHGKHPFRSL